MNCPHTGCLFQKCPWMPLKAPLPKAVSAGKGVFPLISQTPNTPPYQECTYWGSLTCQETQAENTVDSVFTLVPMNQRWPLTQLEQTMLDEVDLKLRTARETEARQVVPRLTQSRSHSGRNLTESVQEPKAYILHFQVTTFSLPWKVRQAYTQKDHLSLLAHSCSLNCSCLLCQVGIINFILPLP